MFKNLPNSIFIAIVVSAIVFLVIAFFLAKRYIKEDKSKMITIRIVATLLLLLVIANRAVKTYYFVEVVHYDGYTWWYLLPDTVCSFVAYCLPITLLIKPKKECYFHAVIYLAFAGGLGGFLAPYYFDEYPLEVFWKTTCILSFLMHTILMGLPILILLFKQFNPKIKTWYYTILTYGVAMLLGVFEIYVLRFPDEAHVMNLFHPLLSGLPVLTSWYMLWIGYTIGVTLFLFIYERFVYHKKCIDILKDMNPFKK